MFKAIAPTNFKVTHNFNGAEARFQGAENGKNKGFYADILSQYLVIETVAC
jgi:hypothetical protein